MQVDALGTSYSGAAIVLQQLQLISAPVVTLVLLSLCETLLGAQVGKATGTFYAALLDDREKRRFLIVLVRAAGWFAAAGLVKSSISFLSEQLALVWRRRLTGHLQQSCGRRHGYYWLRDTCDNLDQRLLQDVVGFCSKLAGILPVVATAPFRVLFYSVWVARLTGKVSLAALYAFFLMGVAAQRCGI